MNETDAHKKRPLLAKKGKNDMEIVKKNPYLN